MVQDSRKDLGHGGIDHIMPDIHRTSRLAPLRDASEILSDYESAVHASDKHSDDAGGAVSGAPCGGTVPVVPDRRHGTCRVGAHFRDGRDFRNVGHAVARATDYQRPDAPPPPKEPPPKPPNEPPELPEGPPNVPPDIGPKKMSGDDVPR